MYLVFIYIAAIILANLSTGLLGPSMSIINSFLMIGLLLSTRDALHDKWRDRLAVRMTALVFTGAAISYVLSLLLNVPTSISIASFVAFCASELVDTFVYQKRINKPFIRKANESNIYSAAVDSVVFPVLAFGGFPIWIILGQFLAKVGGGFIWSLILNRSKRQ